MESPRLSRKAFIGALLAIPALAQDESEFIELMNDFIIKWNEFANGIARHKFDVQKAKSVRGAWERLTAHPGWLLRG
jgi:hypothetical protein